MPGKAVNTLILDLDNTIFDWFAVWYATFEPIYSEIISVTGAPVEEVEKQIREVHQLRRTSEYTFLLEELQLLEPYRKSGDIREKFKVALEKSREGRDRALRLYPSVFQSLWDIKSKGTKIVAYTESMEFYSAYRLKRFGLDGVIDLVFSPQDHVIPAGVSLEKMRRQPDEFYGLQVTETRHTPPGELKPNARVLIDIITSVGASIDTCAYIGDSLFKDVAMARDVRVFDLHAKYGESQRRPEYELLKRVSHWTEKDVLREAEITKNGHNFEPSAVLKECFGEIFMYCDFVPFLKAGTEIANGEEAKNAIEIWKKCVDVQQHFNDLSLRVRNFAITALGALIAAVGFTYQQGLRLQLFGHQFIAGVIFVGAAFFAWTAFFLMDRFWYHTFLRGAVDHAIKIESQYKNRIPGIELGETIAKASQGVQILGFSMNSRRRLSVFYVFGYIALALIFALLLFAQPMSGTNPSNGTPSKTVVK